MNFFFYFLATIGNLILRGFVFSRLWAWFVVRQFDVKPVSVAMAIGLGTLVSLVTFVGHEHSKLSPAEQKERVERGIDAQSWGTTIGFTLIYLALWLQGYVVNHFLG